MIRRPTRSTRTDTLFPYTTLFRSDEDKAVRPGMAMGRDLAIAFAVGERVEGVQIGEFQDHDLLIRPLAFLDDRIVVGGDEPAIILLEHRAEAIPIFRSAERRVGKECVTPCRYRWLRYH